MEIDISWSDILFNLVHLVTAGVLSLPIAWD